MLIVLIHSTFSLVTMLDEFTMLYYRGELKKLDSTTGRSTNETQESPATSKSYLEGLEGCSDSFELHKCAKTPQDY